MIDAVAAFEAWERDSLLPGQELVEHVPGQRTGRLRKRAKLAAEQAGIELETRKKAPAAP